MAIVQRTRAQIIASRYAQVPSSPANYADLAAAALKLPDGIDQYNALNAIRSGRPAFSYLKQTHGNSPMATASVQASRDPAHMKLFTYDNYAKQSALDMTQNFVQAVSEWNSGAAFSEPWFGPLFARFNGYFQQGQAARGRMTAALGQAALRQWAVDEAPSGGIFSHLSNLLSPAVMPVVRVVQHTNTVVLEKANKVATIVTVHTPGFHALPKDLQKNITETPLIPSSMHELEDRMRVNRRLAESKLQYIDPVVKQFFEHEQRTDEMTMVQGMLVAAEADYKIHPTPEKYAYIQSLMARMALLSSQEQRFMHNAKIFAVVVSIVATVFTMGTASAPLFAAWGAFTQAVGQGVAAAIKLAIKMVLSMIQKMATLSELQFAQMSEALYAMAAYPPPKSITEPAKQMEYSLAQKTAAETTAMEQSKKSGSLFPLVSGGLTLLSVLV